MDKKIYMIDTLRNKKTIKANGNCTKNARIVTPESFPGKLTSCLCLQIQKLNGPGKS